MQFETVPTNSGLSSELSLEDFLHGAATSPMLAFDTEGTGTKVLDGQHYAYGISAAYRHPHLGLLSHYMPFKHNVGVNLDPRRLELVKDVFKYREENNLPVTSHNLQFDLPALETLGIKYGGPAHCTLVQSQLVNENYPFSKSLETCSQVYLGQGKIEHPFDPRNELNWYWAPSEVLYEYARVDAVRHLELAEKIHPLMEAENLFEYVWPQKLAMLRNLIKMRRRGIEIDVEECEKMAFVGNDIMQDITDMLGLNPGSSKDLEYLLTQRLGLPIVKRNDPTPKMLARGIKEGNPSFDKDAMEIYDQMLEFRNDPTAKLIAEYRGWQKAVTACYNAYIHHLSPDGRVRANYHQHRARTMRLSSSDPNVQQIPRETTKPWHGGVKRVFRGRRGYVLVEGDYSQLEFRLGAAYAGETNLIEVFNDEDRDIFYEMTVQLGNPRTEAERYKTKTKVYTTTYGGGANRLSQVFGISLEEAIRQRDQFRAVYRNLYKKSQQATSVAKRNRKVKLWNGRYRHLPHKDDWAKAFNSIMQGGAADIMECTIDRISREVDNEEECRMVNTVHDSIWFEVREDLVEKYKPVIKESMEKVTGLNGMDFGVKFAVDVHPVAKVA